MIWTEELAIAFASLKDPSKLEWFKANYGTTTKDLTPEEIVAKFFNTPLQFSKPGRVSVAPIQYLDKRIAYEILSFSTSDSSFNYIKKEDGRFSPTVAGARYRQTEQYLLKQVLVGAYKVQSVKRLSDGEVFTVGDRLADRRNDVIVEIKLDFNGYPCWLYTGNDFCGVALPYAKKYTPPYTFTTEDGEALAGETVWGVALQATGQDKIKSRTIPYNGGMPMNRKWFKDKFKAETYLRNYKPCLSLDDVLSVVTISHNELTPLLNLIKSKI